MSLCILYDAMWAQILYICAPLCLALGWHACKHVWQLLGQLPINAHAHSLSAVESYICMHQLCRCRTSNIPYAYVAVMHSDHSCMHTCYWADEVSYLVQYIMSHARIALCRMDIDYYMSVLVQLSWFITCCMWKAVKSCATRSEHVWFMVLKWLIFDWLSVSTLTDPWWFVTDNDR